MSRYIVDIDDLWEHNRQCELCQTIDRAYDAIVDQRSSQADVTRLEELLVNGYGRPAVVEATGNAGVETVVSELEGMVSYNDDVYQKALAGQGFAANYDKYAARQPTAMYGRWCRDCGARKPSIVDLNARVDLTKYSLSTTVTGRHVGLTWTVARRELQQTLTITRRDDLGAQVEVGVINLTYASSTSGVVVDEVPGDGRVYTYTANFVDECGLTVVTRESTQLVVVDVDHVPKPVDVKFVRHARLEATPTGYQRVEFTRLDFVKPVDPNFGRVVVKLNDDHEPGVDYWVSDLEFSNTGEFTFTDDKHYFAKTIVESRVFKKDGVNDHDRYPDLFFYNTSAPVVLLHREPFPDDLYALKFADGQRSMTINYSLKVGTTARFVRVMFKQGESVVTDDDDGTFKVVDVPVVNATYDYCVTITGLAANSFWTFGVFPAYADTDPDVRLDYQTIVKIRPWYRGEHQYTLNDFYYTGRWLPTPDFTDYQLSTYTSVVGAEARGHQVMACEHVAPGDVAVLLIHDDDVAEQFTVTYDHKLISKNYEDQLNAYVNHHRFLSETTTGGRWQSTSTTFTNASFLIARWEQLKVSTQPWTATFVDNVVVHSETVVDVDVHNFTRDDTLKFKEYYYFNRTTRYDAVQQFTPKKYYCVDVKINPYFDENGKRVVEVSEND